jgi:hypothetical protein
MGVVRFRSVTRAVIVGAVAVGGCGDGYDSGAAVLDCVVAFGAVSESVEFPLVVDAPVEVSVDGFAVVFERLSDVSVQARVSTAAGVPIVEASSGVPVNPQLTTLAGSALTRTTGSSRSTARRRNRTWLPVCARRELYRLDDAGR